MIIIFGVASNVDVLGLSCVMVSYDAYIVRLRPVQTNALLMCIQYTSDECTLDVHPEPEITVEHSTISAYCPNKTSFGWTECLNAQSKEVFCTLHGPAIIPALA